MNQEIENQPGASNDMFLTAEALAQKAARQAGRPRTEKIIIRRLEGVVVSAKMAKTVVVRVDRQVTHKKYFKKYTVSKKYKAHDEKGQYKEGDQVVIAACRPLSKDKRWRVLRKIEVKK